MLYKLAANAVALSHLAFILFVVFGGLVVLRWPRLAWLHVPAAIWGAVVELGGLPCPLTRVENALLRRAGAAGYDGGFIAHYLFAIIYPAGLTRGVEIILGIIVIVLNAGVYVRVFR